MSSPVFVFTAPDRHGRPNSTFRACDESSRVYGALVGMLFAPLVEAIHYIEWVDDITERCALRILWRCACGHIPAEHLEQIEQAWVHAARRGEPDPIEHEYWDVPGLRPVEVR